MVSSPTIKELYEICDNKRHYVLNPLECTNFIIADIWVWSRLKMKISFSLKSDQNQQQQEVLNAFFNIISRVSERDWFPAKETAAFCVIKFAKSAFYIKPPSLKYSSSLRTTVYDFQLLRWFNQKNTCLLSSSLAITVGARPLPERSIWPILIFLTSLFTFPPPPLLPLAAALPDQAIKSLVNLHKASSNQFQTTQVGVLQASSNVVYKKCDKIGFERQTREHSP